MKGSEIVEKMTILRKISRDFNVESAYFAVHEPTTLIIIFRTVEDLDLFFDSEFKVFIEEKYSLRLSIKE